jgi:DNA helicase-2/ATP-dependent DNA helicase PcrA
MMVAEADIHPLLKALDPQQRAAAMTLRGPVSILAGAGSGKTRTISHRIAYGIDQGVYAANRVLALTYTNRAASELRQRLRLLGASGVQVRTFHSAALSQLQFFWPQLTESLAPKLMTSKVGAVKDVLSNLRIELADDSLRELIAELEWMRYSLTRAEDYPQLGREVAGFSAERFLGVVAGYEELKQKRRVADWEDVIALTTGLLRSETRMLEHFSQQYRFFTVDEYQDISPLQQALLETWLGDREDLCVVGDPRQAIYGFAGADAGFLTSFASRFSNAEVFELTANYRSAVEIVSLANKVADHGELVGTRSFSARPTKFEASSVSAEAKRIAERIQVSLDAGKQPSEIAVLSRINQQLLPIEHELKARGVPVQVRGAGRFFAHPQVLKTMTALSALQVSSGNLNLFESLSEILRQLGWSSRGHQDENWQRLNWFMEVFEELSEPTLDEYLRELEERERSGDEPMRNTVTLATIHATKGLEWSSVYLCGMNQGLFPISHAKSDAALAEERRLFYVAVTRAKDQLTLSSISDRQPSEYLALLDSRS